MIMKKLFRSFIVLMMAFSMMACQKQEPVEDPKVQEAFNAYLDEKYIAYFEDSYFNYYDLFHPETLGVTKPEVRWWHYTVEEFEKTIKDSKEELEKLHTFDKNVLTQDQQNLYLTFEKNLQNNIELEKYLDFSFPFKSNGVQETLIGYFTEWRAVDEEKLEDYIVLIEDSGRVIDECIEWTQKQKEKGLLQNEGVKASILDYCRNFLESKEIEKHAQAMIDKLELSTDKQETYMKRISDGVDQVIKPAYKRIIELYENLPVAENQKGYYYDENGKEYYEYMIHSITVSNRSMSQWMNMLEKAIDEHLDYTINLMISDPDLITKLSNAVYPIDNAKDCLEYHSMHLEDYPEIQKVDYSVNYLDASVAQDMVSAYYVNPPIDDVTENVIKVNPNKKNIGDIYATLAHEGFPGHLYYSNYINQNANHPIKKVISNLTLIEGWATYVAAESYQWSGLDESVIEYYSLMEGFGYLVEEYIDMKIHYEGWGVDEIRNYLDKMGLKTSIAEAVYDSLITNPAILAPYGLGYLEMYELRKQCEQSQKDAFDLKEFHRVILDCGAISLDALENTINNYCK